MKYVIQFLFAQIDDVVQNECRIVPQYKLQNMSLYVYEELLWYSAGFEFDSEAKDGYQYLIYFVVFTVRLGDC